MELRKPCEDCDGTGVSREPEWLDDPPVAKCPACGGKGYVRRWRLFREQCWRCAGGG